MKITHLVTIGLLISFMIQDLKAQNSNIAINELMASNTATVADNAGDFDDWIEFYNNGSTAVDMSGWHLTDDPTRLDKWSFPEGAMIGPGGYRIVWADEDGSQGDMHANFKLSASGEILILSDSLNNLIDEITFGEQTTDLGYARSPNGTGDFMVQGPTFRANNDWPVSTDEIELAVDFKIAPNPATTFINVNTSEQDEKTLKVFNIVGQQTAEIVFLNQTTIDVSNWTSGTYFLKIGGTTQKIMVK